MKHLLLFVFLSCFSAEVVFAQLPGRGQDSEDSEGGGIARKFSEKKEKQKRAPINSYKIISKERDTTYLDTSLTIQKEYKFNYLRKDAFELEGFSNIGGPYTQLAKQTQAFEVLPTFGARARHIGYLEADDINYYQAATPLTELYYKTAQEQGQQLDAFITINTSPNLNFSLAFKGVRSLGTFQNILTSTRSFRGTISYVHPSKRYVANAHFTDQRLLNEENGGLTDANGLPDFIERSDESDDRSILAVNFENAENILNGKRYFLNHEYRIFKPDTLGNGKLSVGHELEFTNKKYDFTQTSTNEEFFGTARTEVGFTDRVELDLVQNALSLNYTDKNLGDLKFFAKHTYFNYGYDNQLLAQNTAGDLEVVVADRLIDNLISIGANYENTYKGFLLKGNAESVISGSFSNQYFNGTAGYRYKDKFDVKFGYELKSEAQSFNKILNQSNYIDYNYQNDFDNTLSNTFSVNIKSNKNFWVDASFSLIDKYAYFDRVSASPEDDDAGDGDLDDDGNVIAQVSSPTQTDDVLSVLKIKAYKEFAYKGFRLANTVLFQQVGGDASSTYNVPELTTRNSLYYQGNVFKNAMFLQTGITYKYFSEYFADGYDPLLADYYVQNDTEIGGYSQLDFFVNARVRQTRIFLKLENLQNALSQNNDLVAPTFASRDFLIRFGLVWNFFL